MKNARIKTNLKIIPYSKIYALGNSTPDESYVEVKLGKNTLYIKSEDVARLKMTPDSDLETGHPQVTGVYQIIEEVEKGLKVKKRNMSRQELTDLCDQILDEAAFGTRRTPKSF